ncbi:MAG: ATP phosphoribosyltransferase regulatory subunit [bacterium]|nr:ATP phosphoribosyltransferase regulatory subunit [bacterium]
MSELIRTAFNDFLPDKHEYLTYIKKVLRHRFRQAGFRRITPSLLIPIEVCEKALEGNEKEVLMTGSEVQDESTKERGIIRFDPLISIGNAYLQNGMKDWAQPVELYYIDSFLKKDLNKHIISEIDFGIQVIGSSDAALTAQVIYLGNKILDDLGLREMYTVNINHIGSQESRTVYLDDLKNFYFDKQRSLCEKCVKNYERGHLLQLLRCHEEDCAILAQLAPKLENYLSKEDQEQYEHLKAYLEELGVGFRENKSLFGIGNYNAQTVFEFWNNDKGAERTIFHGGSNDEIIERMGGEKTNMIGFSSDTNALIEGMQESGIRVPHKDHLQVFVAQLGVNAKKKALSLLQRLRESGIQAVGAMGTGSMRTQLDMATDFKVKYTLLMGEVEVKEGMLIIRDMDTGTQESVPYDHVVEIMQERIGKEKMDVMEDQEKSIDLKRKGRK